MADEADAPKAVVEPKADEPKKDDIFGSSSDSDDSDDEAPTSTAASSSSSATKAKAALSSSGSDSSSSSSSSDSDSDSDASPSPQNKRRRLQQGGKKKKKKKSKGGATKQRPRRNPSAGKDDAPPKRERRDGESSDEYDSDEVVEDAGDRAFIDNDLDSDDDLGLKEAYGGKQQFDDERPDDYRKPKKDRDRDDEAPVDDSKKNAMDRALDALKVGRARKKGSGPNIAAAELDNIVQDFLNEMDGAYKDDVRARKEGRVALAKVRFLPTVVKMLGRRDSVLKSLLDCDFLGLIRKWLHPLPNGTLPSFQVRVLAVCPPVYACGGVGCLPRAGRPIGLDPVQHMRCKRVHGPSTHFLISSVISHLCCSILSRQVRSQVLAALHKMPDTAGEDMVTYLRRSEIGKTLMLLWKHKDEHTQNKTVIRELVERWSRPVLNKTADYRQDTKRKRAQQSEGAPRARKAALGGAGARGSGEHVDLQHRKAVDNSAVETVYGAVVSDRVVIPKPMAFDFKRRLSQSEVSAKAPSHGKDSARGKMAKRMIDLSRPKKGGESAIKMSIEGRGL